jgi:hypothetical protein
MPEETGAAGSGREEDYISRRLDRLEQKLMWEDRWWRGGLIAALFFIGIAILVAGHHHRRPPMPPWMAYGQAGMFPPPPMPWEMGRPGGYGAYGWGPGPWGERQPPPPPPPAR